MKQEYQGRTIKEMLINIEKNPGIYLGTNERRLDYLCHFLDGWFINNENELNNKYHAQMANWIYNWIMENRSLENKNIKFSFLWYDMLYSITKTEDEAWELFFHLSYEYLSQLESEKK